MALWLGLALFVAVPAHAAPVEWLPTGQLRLTALRYTSAEPQFKWSGWIGGGLGLVRVGATTLHVDTDVETIIGNEQRSFDANQANYHLEASGRQALGDALEASVVFHHVSRHLEDRAKSSAVDWNMLSLSVTRRFQGALPLRVSVGLGHTVQDSLVNYGWEARAGLHAELLRSSGAQLYLATELRYVQAEATAAFPRDSFLDTWLEAGAQLARGGRRAALLLAFERRNDVFLLQPGARSRVLLGLRLGLGEPAP
jgi:hypothetical protein